MTNIGDLKIIAERECSGMVSVWDEYLCLRKVSETKYELSVRAYEVLAEGWDYYDEESEDYDLPDEINGKAVVGFVDEWIVGGSLIETETFKSLIFSDLTHPDVAQWFNEVKWNTSAVMSALQSAVEN
jgi:uncharacterized protein YacL (UPF0231 family)